MGICAVCVCVCVFSAQVCACYLGLSKLFCKGILFADILSIYMEMKKKVMVILALIIAVKLFNFQSVDYLIDLLF